MQDLHGLALALSAALLASALAAPASAGPRDPLLVWTDDAGVVRYTTHPNRIPLTQRDRAEIVAAVDTSALDGHIADLQRQIAENESALAAYLSKDGEPSDRAALEAVAERLPRLQEELRSLLARRNALRPADAP